MTRVGMVGRDDEMRRCRAAIERSGCDGIVIVGPPGVGKSRLAGAVADELSARGWELVRIAGTTAAATIPMGAIASLLSQPSSPTTPADLIRHTIATLSARRSEAGLVLLVEDAHLIDAATATLVHQLASGGTAFVIVTARTTEVVPDTITALWKEGVAERLDIDALGLGDSTLLAESMLDERLEPAAAQAVFDRSQGNPLFIEQLIAGALEDGALQLDRAHASAPAVWRLVRPLPVSADLVDVIDERLAALGPDDREVLELLAIGEPLGAAVLEDLLGTSAAERLSALEAAGYIVADVAGRRLDVRLGHPLYNEVLRRVMPLTFANQARIRLSDALIARGARRREDAMRIALWRIDAGVQIPGDIARVAAEQALVRLSSDLAERIIAAAGGGPNDPASLLLHAFIESRSGRATPALARLDQLDAALGAPSPADVDAAARARLRADSRLLRFNVVGFQLARARDAFAIELDGDADASSQRALAARKSVLAVLLGRPTTASQILAGMEPRAARHVPAEMWVDFAQAMTDGALGATRRAADAIDRVVGALGAGWDPSMPDPATIAIVRVQILQTRGDVEAGLALAREETEHGRDWWPKQGVAWIECAASTMHRLQGDVAAAAAAATSALRLFELPQASPLADMALAQLAAAHALAGDPVGAAAAADRCSTLGFTGFHTDCARAWAKVAAGQTSEGAIDLARVAGTRRGRDAREELLLLLDVVRLGGAAGARDAISDLASRCDSPVATSIAAWATALLENDVDGLEAVAEQFARYGCALVAVEATLNAAAAALRRRDTRRARTLTDSVRGSVSAFRGVSSPSLHPPAVQALLSPRERETTALAATGALAPAIGNTLGLGVRTVESYLRSAYGKLDVSNRTELAEAFTLR